MKRLITCAALLLVTAGVISAVSRAQLARAGDQTEREVIKNGPGLSGFSVETRPQRETLREQYLERQRAKAELMSDEELQEALEATDTEIRAREATQQLDECLRMLGVVREKYEGTPAAEIAAQLLSVIENHGRPTPAAVRNEFTPTVQPTADDAPFIPSRKP